MGKDGEKRRAANKNVEDFLSAAYKNDHEAAEDVVDRVTGRKTGKELPHDEPKIIDGEVEK